MKAKVILADDHQVMREGLRSLLREHPLLEVVGEAASGSEVVRLAAQLNADLVLMDVAMPGLNGLEATRRLKRERAATKVMALTMQTDRHYVIGMLKAGASAYLLKNCSYDELQEAMQIVLRGGSYLSPKIAEVVVATLQAGPGGEDQMDIDCLTSREREVLQLIAEAKKSKEIAEQLCISLKTVYTHRRNIMEKLKAKNVAGLTRFAIKNRITSLTQ